MAKTILGVFPDRYTAEHAVDELIHYGYRHDEISVVMRDREINENEYHYEADRGNSVVGGAVTGAATGGVIGGLAGLLIGVGAIAIPGIGAILIAGPIAAALGLTGVAASTVSGVITGAVAGGLVGALIGLGIPEEDAYVYEDRIRVGGVLVAVPAASENESEVRDLFVENDAENIRVIDTDAYEDEEEFREYYTPRAYIGTKGGRRRKIRNDKYDDED